MRVPLLDKARIRRSFDRASHGYDAAAVLQAEVRKLMLERLQFTALTPRVVLDAGAGTGHASRALKRRYPAAQVIALDSSFGMLRAARHQQSWFRPVVRVCADSESLPLREESVDLIWSNFLLPWVDPAIVFAEWRRVMTPRGLLTFTTVGPDTLKELRMARLAAGLHADHPPADSPSGSGLGLLDMHDLGDGLVRAGFAAPVLDVERFTLAYRDLEHLARDLQANGARIATADRPGGLLGRRQFAALKAAYEEYREEGRLPATVEVVFGQAWAPVAEAPRPGTGSDARFSLEDLRSQLRPKRQPPSSPVS